MLQIKHNNRQYQAKWKHSRKNFHSYCELWSSVDGLLTISKVSNCVGKECFDTTYGKKESLKQAILESIPREDVEVREKLWRAFVNMTKTPRWKMPETIFRRGVKVEYDVLSNTTCTEKGSYSIPAEPSNVLNTDPKFLSRTEAADILNISLTTLWRRTKNGELTSYTINGKRKYLQSELTQDELIGAQEAAKVLGVSVPTLYRKSNAGKIKVHMIKGKQKFLKKELV